MEETKEKVEGEETVSDLDALKQENEALKSQLNAKHNLVIELEQKLAVKDNEIADLKQSLDAALKDAALVRQQLAEAVAAYKEMVEQANPGLVAGMIKGNTVVEISESVKSARALVEKVKQEVAAESARVRVPAGAPQRTPLDLSGLTSREKIKYAMEGG
jgi:DNA repair exonuclease SbcCD ATPase subunit